MKQVSYIILIALFAGLGSCKKFLDVKPEDSVQEDLLYTSEPGFQTHLNGIYLGLTAENLYGGQLTMEMLDVLAQRYNCPSINHRYNDLAAYNFTSPKVLPKITSAWNGLYRMIGNVNTVIAKADEHKEIFTGINYELIKGEALGLRAFLHFDALRMFGMIYNKDSAATKRIPYYTAKTTVAGELLTGKEVVEKLITDLNEAESFLQKDPIITRGKAGNASSTFTQARHLRMNYYAVKLLQARVYLYANRPAEALAAAKVVIDKQDAWFPFVTSSQVQHASNPDRVFSGELVFAMQDISITDKYNKYFLPRQLDTLILAPIQTRLNTAYESSTNDYRNYSQTWSVPSDGSKAYKCFNKYAPTNDTAVRKYSVPLMRVTEAYLIAAEASTVTAEKYQYLNAVRNARNLTSTSATFTTELTKEYVKEFYGEGQLFFYYKRNNTGAIANGSASSGNITMNDVKYVLPLPESETSSRN